ncbi:hypothetical protein BS78_09G246400 [Paspalum vaginatum]|nr:hypothetical protein BS78_09G246400 [Paspalum vaginatum]
MGSSARCQGDESEGLCQRGEGLFVGLDCWKLDPGHGSLSWVLGRRRLCWPALACRSATGRSSLAGARRLASPAPLLASAGFTYLSPSCRSPAPYLAYAGPPLGERTSRYWTIYPVYLGKRMVSRFPLRTA